MAAAAVVRDTLNLLTRDVPITALFIPARVQQRGPTDPRCPPE